MTADSEKIRRRMSLRGINPCLFLAVAIILIHVTLLPAFSIEVSTLNKGPNTVDSIIALHGATARGRLKERFARASLSYPPRKLIMLGLKSEGLLELYACFEKPQFHYVCSYPILARSGVLGPKLKEGDKQMPEGFYRIKELEPNSAYHLAMRLNYPNDFDREKGQKEGRENLGSDIMIHGNNRSVGCFAMGDPAAEELFLLLNDVGLSNAELILSPCDFRKPPQGVKLPVTPEWIGNLYSQLEDRLRALPSHD